MTWLLPVAATVAAVGLTWWFCMRPMLRSGDGGTPSAPGCCTASTVAQSETAEQIKAVRAELDELRAAREARTSSPEHVAVSGDTDR